MTRLLLPGAARGFPSASSYLAWRVGRLDLWRIHSRLMGGRLAFLLSVIAQRCRRSGWAVDWLQNKLRRITERRAGTGNGVLIQPTSGNTNFVITNTIASNNGLAGIAYSPPLNSTPSANGFIDHVVASANLYGIYINTGPIRSGSTFASISNSAVINNGAFGIDATNSIGAQLISIDNVSATGNGTGVDAANTTKVLLGRSVITGNNTGVQNDTSPNTFYTYQDNRISANISGKDITSPLNPNVTPQ